MLTNPRDAVVPPVPTISTAQQKQFQKWEERFDKKYSKGAAKLVEIVVDTINLENKSRK